MQRALSFSFLAVLFACSADPNAVKGGAPRDGFDAAAPPPFDAGVTEHRKEDDDGAEEARGDRHLDASIEPQEPREPSADEGEACEQLGHFDSRSGLDSFHS